jgi:preprotein translocase subunit SecG
VYYFVLVIHFIVTVALVIIVLLQTDKGEGLSGAFGGGANLAMFGSNEETTGITKLTTGVAIIFMLTSLTLAILSKKVKSDVGGYVPTPPAATAPATK